MAKVCHKTPGVLHNIDPRFQMTGTLGHYSPGNFELEKILGISMVAFSSLFHIYTIQNEEMIQKHL